MSEAHRCAAGRGCRDKIVDQATGKREPAQTEKARDLCGRCTNQVHNALSRLLEDMGTLADASGDRAQSSGDKVTGTREASIPLNTSTMALSSTLSQWCGIAVEMVAGRLNIEPVKRQKARGFPPREYRVTSQAANVLPANVDLLLEAESRAVTIWNRDGTASVTEDHDGISVALAILRCHWQVVNILGEANPRKRLSMPCPIMDCGAMTLGINNGESQVTCLTCGGHWTEREYEWLAGMVVSEHKQEKKAMLEWLLAEAKYHLETTRIAWDQDAERLNQALKLANLTAEQLEDTSAAAVAAILKEIITT